MKKRLLSLIALAAACCMNVTAQFQQYTEDNEPEQETSLLSQISAGIGTGFYSSFLQYSNLDRELFPSQSNLNSGVFSLFAEYQFGSQRQFGIRPQLSWLRRGG